MESQRTLASSQCPQLLPLHPLCLQRNTVFLSHNVPRHQTTLHPSHVPCPNAAENRDPFAPFKGELFKNNMCMRWVPKVITNHTKTPSRIGNNSWAHVDIYIYRISLRVFNSITHEWAQRVNPEQTYHYKKLFQRTDYREILTWRVTQVTHRNRYKVLRMPLCAFFRRENCHPP